jgi:DNA-binding LytR/AlgR family response regulator
VRRDLLALMHATYWGLYLALLSLVLLMIRGTHGGGRPFAGLIAAWPILALALAPNAAAFYAAYHPLFTRFLARRRFGGLLAAGTVAAVSAAALGLALAYLFFGPRQAVFSSPRELASLVVSLSALAAVHMAAALVARGFEEWYGGIGVTDVMVLAEKARDAIRHVIFVKTEQRLEKVRLDEILVIEGQRDYRRIHTAGRRIMTLQTFAEFERDIPPDVVCRVHKSYMVALDKIESVERGRITVHSLASPIPISDTYKDRFYALIGHGRR